jgi:hypothetical protein
MHEICSENISQLEYELARNMKHERWTTLVMQWGLLISKTYSKKERAATIVGRPQVTKIIILAVTNRSYKMADIEEDPRVEELPDDDSDDCPSLVDAAPAQVINLDHF